MPEITFVLPGRGSSGGVRVTVEMANQLLLLDYNVRIAHRVQPVLSKGSFRGLARKAWTNGGLCFSNTDWLEQFKGRSEKFTDLRKLRFSAGEIVIAVGTHTVHDVSELDSNIIKVRFNHGLNVSASHLTNAAWSLPMLTITVSHTLIPVLESLSGGKVLAVIPNGTWPHEYHVEDIDRDGIGFVYSSDPIKAPEHALELMQSMSKTWPVVRQYSFGADRRPKGARHLEYTRYPSIEKARKIYNRCLIWLLPSRGEGFPAPVLEAMACGCVVISTNNLGSCEIVRHGVNGFLVDVGDLNAFMKYIRMTLDDPALRERLVAGGLNTVREFSWNNAVTRMDRFLKHLIEGRRYPIDDLVVQ
jgi:glycosyltransferase involved in cell wall biosynthesis